MWRAENKLKPTLSLSRGSGTGLPTAEWHPCRRAALRNTAGSLCRPEVTQQSETASSWAVENGLLCVCLFALVLSLKKKMISHN